MISLERWKNFDIRQQMGHITSELTRAAGWEGKQDILSRNESLVRALELIGLTVECYTKTRRREIARLKEVTASLLDETRAYQVELRDLVSYGMRFIL